MIVILTDDVAVRVDNITAIEVLGSASVRLTAQGKNGEKGKKMPRLIDADKLMETIKAHHYPLVVKGLNTTDYGMFTIGIQQAVDEQPTVDAEFVVRCKDCKWCCCNDGMCTRDRLYRVNSISLDGETYFRKVEPNDFCSWAERRKDAKTD